MYDYCEREEDHVTIRESKCEGCSYGSCKYYPSKKGAYQKFKNQAFASDVKGQLTAHFGMDDAAVEKELGSLFDSLNTVANTHIRSLIRDGLRCHIAQNMESRIEAMLGSMFEDAMLNEVLSVDKEGKAMMTTVQKMAADRIGTFISKQSMNRKNTSHSDTIDAALERVVGEKVDEAIKELTTEAIDKFNKAAMKKMMAGMAAAIGNDKRLLAVLTE